MRAHTAPRDVYETREGDHRCGICHREVIRYSAPRAGWVHAMPAPEPTRCRGTTKKGVQCSRFTRRNPSYCWEHR